MNTQASTAQRLATVLLEQPVEEWIAGQRELGLSWRDVADTLATVTRGQVVITHETARMWSSQ